MNNRPPLLLFMVLIVADGIFNVGLVVGQTNCPNGENYEPCTCLYFTSDGKNSVECNGVLIEDVLSVFKRTTPSELKRFTFYPSVNDTHIDSTIIIPKDFLGEHWVQNDIQLFGLNSSYHLRIEPEAFRSSRNFTERFHLRDWDISRLDFNFLTGFNNLSSLELSEVSNVHLTNWTSLPPLPNLKMLSIYESTGLNDWESFPHLIRGLEVLELHRNDIQNVPMDRILNWTVGHSGSTLQTLNFDFNDLTRIPLQIPTFKSLSSISIDNQNTGIPFISSGSLKFTAPVRHFSADLNGIARIEAGAFQGNFSGGYLYLPLNKIETINPGAFQGNFKDAYVYLSFNNLTRFEELVFKEMLQQMVNQSSGGLYADENPFDCESDPCHLIWLIRDNRDLLTSLSAACADGTSFKKLNSSELDSRCASKSSSVRSSAHNHITELFVALVAILMLTAERKFVMNQINLTN